ncbi:Proteophosphoglycan ppg [Salix suchowensis]|nr:Proteophosphoglycan ppg [Salix suchowensis]
MTTSMTRRMRKISPFIAYVLARRGRLHIALQAVTILRPRSTSLSELRSHYEPETCLPQFRHLHHRCHDADWKDTRTNLQHNCYQLRDRDASSLIADSWYIGAFGRWWRGGVIEAWYRDLIARSSDEESWSSGILGIKSLDKFNNDCNVRRRLPFTAKTRESTPKVRGRDRLQSSHQSRSQSPPPLPQPVSDTATPDVNSAVPLSRTLSVTLFDQSPLIAEVLRQISAAKTSIHDTRIQLTEQQASAAQSHASLQSEVTTLRDRKRDEDATRLDLKSRTRALEETKRVSESSRRDAERRLKAARSARDDVSCRNKGHHSVEIEISEAIDEKRKEIKVAEDIVATLALRAKGLEEKLANERERLKALRARVEHDRQTLALAASQSTSQELWTISQQPGFVPSPITECSAEIFDAGLPSLFLTTQPITSTAISIILQNISLPTTVMMCLLAKGFVSYPHGLQSSFNHRTSSHYQLFTDHALLSLFNRRSFVATNYISTLDSTQHDASPFPSDLSFDGRWRRNVSSGIQELRDTQAIDMHHFRHPLGTSEMGLVEDASNRDVLRGQSAIRRAMPHRTYSEPPHVHNSDQSWEAVTAGGHDGGKGSFPRRWFSTSSKGPKKGLNPDAKVFSLPSCIKGSNPVLSASLGLQSYDNLNPTASA